MSGKSQHVLPFITQAVAKASLRGEKQTEWRIDGVRGLILVITEGGDRHVPLSLSGEPGR